ncbi:MAG: radical SAM protein [Elusimicrobiota bacterium]
MQAITRKSLLYHSGVEYADYCLNHVEGCSHGCKYPCYAFMMKKRCGVVKTYEDWCKPKIVSNAIQLLNKEIPKYKDKIKYVHLCFSTDPFMYQQDEIQELSLEIIDLLNLNGIRCTTLTKGTYPKELAKRNGYSTNNEYGITLVSLNEKFRKQFEPNTSKFADRIQSLRHLHDKGFKTWVSMEPYPTPNIAVQDLMEILTAVSFVDKIIFGRLNYNAKSSEYSLVKDYYNNLADTVIDFCGNNNIEYHIKHGTQQH